MSVAGLRHTQESCYACGHLVEAAFDEDGTPRIYEPVEVPSPPDSTDAMTFRDVALISAQRCTRWHDVDWKSPDAKWTGADWSNAMCGEAGEAANVVKKLRRLDLGLWGNRKLDDSTRPKLIAKLATEIADTYLYMDLLATYYGVDVALAIAEKFNAISEEAGFPERLPAHKNRFEVDTDGVELRRRVRQLEMVLAAAVIKQGGEINLTFAEIVTAGKLWIDSEPDGVTTLTTKERTNG